MEDFIVVGTPVCNIRLVVKILFNDKALNSFSDTWTSLALDLGIAIEVVLSFHNKLKVGKVTFYDTLLKVVTFWVRNCNGESTLRVFLNALEQNGLFQSVASLRAKYPPYMLIKNIKWNVEETDNETPLLEMSSIGSKITYWKNPLLGRGSMGTKVYKGKFEGRRDIALKRLDKDFFQYQNEVDLLYSSEGHHNIIRYICCEEVDEYFYIALELCQASLDDYVMQNPNGQPFSNADPINLLLQCTSGLNFIHTKGIVHRDIKPENVLLTRNGVNEIIVKISDFGIGKRTEEGRMSFVHSGNGRGTMGWQAPELLTLRQNNRISNKIDVFSLGCLFYFVLSKGKHPFGDYNDRTVLQINIRCSKFTSMSIKEDNRGITTLIKLMAHSDPNKRPLLNAVLNHPMFWDNDKIISLFKEIRSVCEWDKAKTQKAKFEQGRSIVFRDNWIKQVRKDIVKGKYNGNSIVDLVKAIRDKHTHYDELSPKVKNDIGGKSLFILFWIKKFKNLLPYTWGIFECLKAVEPLEAYYDSDFDFQQS